MNMQDRHYLHLYQIQAVDASVLGVLQPTFPAKMESPSKRMKQEPAPSFFQSRGLAVWGIRDREGLSKCQYYEKYWNNPEFLCELVRLLSNQSLTTIIMDDTTNTIRIEQVTDPREIPRHRCVYNRNLNFENLIPPSLGGVSHWVYPLSPAAGSSIGTVLVLDGMNTMSKEEYYRQHTNPQMLQTLALLFMKVNCNILSSMDLIPPKYFTEICGANNLGGISAQADW
jgi:hypothetical protein